MRIKKVTRLLARILGLLLAMMGAGWCAGCFSPSLRVLDASGHPATDAVLRMDYPSFNGPEFHADENGLIRYSKGWLTPVQVVVTSPKSGGVMLNCPPPA